MIEEQVKIYRKIKGQIVIEGKVLLSDEDGNKISDVTGIRAAIKVMKTRFNKPFESVQVKIPYEKGMDPYSGLVDLFEKKGLLVKEGNRLKYVDKAGQEHRHYRKQWTGELMDMVMSDFNETADAMASKEEAVADDN